MLCHLIKKCQNQAFKVNILHSKPSESFWISFRWKIRVQEHILLICFFLNNLTSFVIGKKNSWINSITWRKNIWQTWYRIPTCHHDQHNCCDFCCLQFIWEHHFHLTYPRNSASWCISNVSKAFCWLANGDQCKHQCDIILYIQERIQRKVLAIVH